MALAVLLAPPAAADGPGTARQAEAAQQSQATPEAKAAPRTRAASHVRDGDEDTRPSPLLDAPALVTGGEDLLDRADRASVARAEELFQFALQVDPNLGPAHAGLARVAAIRLSRRWEENDALIDRALAEGRLAVQAGPSDPRSHAALAVASMIAEDWGEALDAADRAWGSRSVETPPWVTEVYAHSLILRGDLERALQIVDEAKRARPARFQVHLAEGNVLLFLGRSDEAIQAFRRVLILEPDFPPAMLQLAEAFDRLGDYGASLDVYKKVSGLCPEEKPRVYARIASSLIARKKYAEALQGLGEVHFGTRRGLGEGTLLYLKGLCWQRLGRRVEARALFEQMVQEYPLASYGGLGGDGLAAAAIEALAMIDLAEGKQEEAVRRMEEARTLDRPTISVFLRLAGVYSGYRLDADAAKVLEGAAGIDFGPRQIGPKTAVYVAWARALRALPAAGPDPAGRLLAALDLDADLLAARGDLVHLIEAARACSLAGSPAKGLQWLRRAVERGYREIDWIRSDPEMALLAGDPGFDQIRNSIPRS